MANQLQFIREVIYNLKREYGERITIGNLIPGETNIQTGRRSNQYSEHRVQRAIMLPNSITFEFLRAVGVIPQQKGMSAPVGAHSILIDHRDIAKFPKPQPGTSFITLKGSRRLDIVHIADYDHAQIIWVKEIIGSEMPTNVIGSALTVNQTV